MPSPTCAPDQDAAALYRYATRVGYSSCTEDARMSLPAIVDLFQDCVTFQSEDLGVGALDMLDAGAAWFLIHWHIVIDRRPRLFEPVAVGTAVNRFRGVTAERSFSLEDGAGGRLVRASSTWAYMDLASMRPTRPDPAFIAPYRLVPAVEMPPEKRHVSVPDGLRPLAPQTVSRHQIDTNRHANNAQYLAMAIDALPEPPAPRSVRVDYKRPAVLGDAVRPFAARVGDRTVVKLADEAGEPFAIVEFEGRSDA